MIEKVVVRCVGTEEHGIGLGSVGFIFNIASSLVLP